MVLEVVCRSVSNANKLSEYGELNQSKLMSYCGLNNVKHKTIIKHKVSEKGQAIFQEILEPYEALFPSEGQRDNDDR
jgi:hypothetical protein